MAVYYEISIEGNLCNMKNYVGQREGELNTVNNFINFLKKEGYPEDNIVTEWGNKKIRADIAVLDKELRFPIAIYEVKSLHNQKSLEAGIAQLKRISDDIKIPITLGVVLQNEKYPYFTYYDVTNKVYLSKEINISEDNEAYRPVDYKTLEQGSIANFKIAKTEAVSTVRSHFKKFCWCVNPCIIIFLVILDKFSILKLTPERLTLYGVGVLLCFLPFISEIKYGDYSIFFGKK